MRAPKCRICGVEHWGSVCAQSEPATKSTAARKDVQAKRTTGSSGPKGQSGKVGDDVAQSGRAAGLALRVVGSIPTITEGTQALPVDTPKKRGRPITSEAPRAAYQRELMRDRRAKLKAQREP